MSINNYLNNESHNIRNKTKSRKIKSKAKIVKPDRVTSFHNPKNIPKLKKIEARLNSMQIPKKWE